MRQPKTAFIWQIFALTGLLLSTAVLPIFAAEDKSDGTYQAGLNLIPADILTRWNSLKEQVTDEQTQQYILEGEEVIRQLGRLTEVVGSTPPQPGSAGYLIYTDTLNNLITLLDKIELTIVLKLPGDEQLEKLLNEYETEKQGLAADVRTERQKLVEMGAKSVEEQLRDPYFRKFPHRRSVVADIYFRLAELTYQETREQFLDEQERYVNRLNELSKSDPKAAAELKPPKPNYRKVLGMYQHIIDEFPDTPYGVDALYNIAILTSESDDPNDKATANQYFETLVDLYPNSRYTLNALQRISEYYFLPPVNNIEKALGIYQRIAREFGNTEYYPDALYMQGWCYYRMSKLPDAVEYFAKTLDTQFAPDGTRLPQQSIRRLDVEAMKYISIAFSVDPREWEGAGVDKFVAWLEAHPARLKNYGGDLLISLGNVLRNELGRYPEGVQAYSKFIELFPNEPRAPMVQLSLVNIYRTGQIYDLAKAHNEVIVFFDTYGPDSPWWQANTSPQVRSAVLPLIASYLDTLINEELVMGVDTGELPHYEAYERYSRQYLRFWPQGPSSYQIHYYLASVLENNLKRPADALREYWQVATGYTDTTYKDIASQRIVAITRDFVKQERDREIYVAADGQILPAAAAPVGVEAAKDTAAADTAAKTPTLARSPLLHSEELILAGFDLYIGAFPMAPLAPTILYQAGSILYDHDWIPESRPYLEKLIAEHPEHKTIEDAYKLLLEGYFRSNDLVGVEAISKRIADANVSDTLKTAAYDRKSVSIFNNATRMVQGEDHLAAAEEFLRVAQETPNSQYADRSLFQAGAEFGKAKAFPKAVDAYMMLVDRYPQSDFAAKALNNVAFTYQNDIKDTARAAATFERLSTAYPKAELVKVALANASFLYSKVQDHISAIRINELYLAAFPKEPDAASYLFNCAGHYLKMNDPARADEIYNRFAKQFPDDPRTVQVHYERGLYALEKNKDKATAAKEYQATVDANAALIARDLPGSPRYASLALVQLLDWERTDYDQLQFRLPMDKLNAAKKRKTEWRDALISKYGKLIQMGQKEGYRGFYDISRLVEEHALATINQDMPEIKDFNKKLEVLDGIIADAILLNDGAVADYRLGYDQLQAIAGKLATILEQNRKEYDQFAAIVEKMQTDTGMVVGLADSTMKLSDMKLVVSDLDSSVTEAKKLAAACAERVPEVAMRNGDFLARLWAEELAWRPAERDEYGRMLLREAWLNNVVAPPAPEVAGLYLKAVNTACGAPIVEPKWLTPLEQKFNSVADTLVVQYEAQILIAQNRLNKYLKEYDEILPKGEDAVTREGFYLEDMSNQILEQIDFWNTFSHDFLIVSVALLDTFAAHTALPAGFGDDGHASVLEFVLKQYNDMSGYIKEIEGRRGRYVAQYKETDQLQYDDATYACADFLANFRDYGMSLLEEGFGLRQKYAIAGTVGIEILKILVALKPDEYVSVVGVQPVEHAVVSNTDWLVWPRAEADYQNPDFDDSQWERATPGNYPAGLNMGAIDSLGAQAIWYARTAPPKGPEWTSMPTSIAGAEGQAVAFTISGTAPDPSRLTIRYQSEDLPALAIFTDNGNGSGTFTWSPTYNDSGSYNATLILTDGEFSVMAGIPITIQNMERALEWVDVPPSNNAEEGGLVEFNVAGFDPDNAGPLQITYQSDNLPAAAQFTDHQDGTGTFSWQTTFENGGNYTANFTLSNGVKSITTAVPISIGNVNHPPVWSETPASIAIETGESVSFTVRGSDEDNDPLKITYSSEYIPAAAAFTDNGDGSGSFAWATTGQDVGNFNARFTLSDGTVTVDAQVPITVGAANKPPVWSDVPGSVSGTTGQEISFTVTGSDPDGSPLTIAFSSDNLPMDAVQFTDNGDGFGRFVWIPGSEAAGSYTARFTLSDGQLTAATDVQISVMRENQAPFWDTVPEQMTVAEGEAVDFSLTGLDPDNNSLTINYDGGSIPAAAQFSDNDNGTGVFHWATAAGDASSYSARFTLSDGNLTAEAMVTIIVTAAAPPETPPPPTEETSPPPGETEPEPGQ